MWRTQGTGITLTKEVSRLANSFTDWEGTCLVHHGIKGQKWGVRRFQNPDGTLTELGRKRFGIDKGGNGKLESSFTRQSKKLSRLERNADIDRQKAISEKYSRRAKRSAKIAAGLGVGAAGSYLNDLSGHKKASDTAYKSFVQNHNWEQEAWARAHGLTGDAREYWIGQANAHSRNAGIAYDKSFDHFRKSSFGSKGSSSIGTKALAAGAAVAGGYAAYSAIRSKVAKNRTTEKGHKKAVEKYKKQYEKMTNQFKDTPYSELLKQKKRQGGK